MQFEPPAVPAQDGPKLFLPLRGCGNIVSFKNSKEIVTPKYKDGTKGRPMLITSPKKQRRMNSYIHAIESMLHSVFRISASGMATGCSRPSWIRSCVPLDDARKWVPEMSVRFVEVPAGDEGADITITRLP